MDDVGDKHLILAALIGVDDTLTLTFTGNCAVDDFELDASGLGHADEFVFLVSPAEENDAVVTGFDEVHDQVVTIGVE